MDREKWIEHFANFIYKHQLLPEQLHIENSYVIKNHLTEENVYVITKRLSKVLASCFYDKYNNFEDINTYDFISNHAYEFFNNPKTIALIKDKQPYIAPISTDVIDSINQYFGKYDLSEYKILNIYRHSNHPDDHYLYMILAQQKDGQYACWTSWNESTKSLNFGHYNLDFDAAISIIKDNFNDITDEIDLSIINDEYFDRIYSRNVQSIDENIKVNDTVVTYTVAECSEFHNLGAYYDNISTIKKAKEIYDSFTSPMVPAIGINVHKINTKEIDDTQYDFFVGNRIDLEYLRLLPDICKKPEAILKLKQLIDAFPRAEVIGNLPNEQNEKIISKIHNHRKGR